MACELHAQLNDKWRIATEKFSRAVAALGGSEVKTISREAYRELRGEAEEARLACDNARLAVDLHANEHGC